MTQHDDGFLARTEPFAAPRGDGFNHGSSGYTEGLRGIRAERRASRRSQRRTATRNAFVVGAGVMGAAVVAAATFTVLVFAGLFTVSSGVDGGSLPVTLVQQPPVTTTPPTSPSDTLLPSEITGALPPSTTAQTGRSPLPSSSRVAASAQRPARSPSNSSGLEQLSSASSPPPSDAFAPATPTTSAPNTNPAGYAPPGRNK